MVCHENWIYKMYTILLESFYLHGSFLKQRYYVYQLVCPLYRQVYNLLYYTIMRVEPMLFSNTHLSRSVFQSNRRHSDTCTSRQCQCSLLHFYKDCWRSRRYLKYKNPRETVIGLESYTNGGRN